LTTEKNEAILRDFLQKWKVESTGDGLVPMRFAIFPLHLFKLLRLPGKSDARSYEVLYLSRKIILANLKISCSKMQPFSRNIRPDLLTHLTNVSLVLRLPREMHLCRSSSNVPRLPSFETATKPLRFAIGFQRFQDGKHHGKHPIIRLSTIRLVVIRISQPSRRKRVVMF